MRGAGRVELAVAATIFAILTAVLLQRVRFYQAEAELAAVERTVGVLRTALAFRQVGLVLSGHPEQGAALRGENPIGWLREPPKNYQGEYYAPPPGQIKPGYWYFDRAAKTLGYVPASRPLPLRYQVRYPQPASHALALVEVAG